MDSEPGGCRRTDGRKWRCSKDVVPLQKYCVSHMHRGRQGSRKQVESPDQSPVKHDSKISKDDSIPTILDTLYVNNSINRHSVEHDDSGIQHSSSGNRISVIIKCRSRRNHGALLVAREVNTDNGTTKGRATSMNNGATNGNHLTEARSLVSRMKIPETLPIVKLVLQEVPRHRALPCQSLARLQSVQYGAGKARIWLGCKSGLNLNQADAKEEMARNGNASEMLFPTRSTVSYTCREGKNGSD